MRACRLRSLEGEPVLQARAAEGMETVQESERLVENVSAYLSPRSRLAERKGSEVFHGDVGVRNMSAPSPNLKARRLVLQPFSSADAESGWAKMPKARAALIVHA